MLSCFEQTQPREQAQYERHRRWGLLQRTGSKLVRDGGMVSGSALRGMALEAAAAAAEMTRLLGVGRTKGAQAEFLAAWQQARVLGGCSALARCRQLCPFPAGCACWAGCTPCKRLRWTDALQDSSWDFSEAVGTRPVEARGLRRHMRVLMPAVVADYVACSTTDVCWNSLLQAAILFFLVQ